MSSSESELQSELRSIEEQLRDSTGAPPFIVGIATIRRQQQTSTSTSEGAEAEEGGGDEGIVVINPTTLRAIFLGFGRATKSGPAPASKLAIEALQVAAVENACECPICLEEMAIGEEAKAMPCNHKFHPGCIDRWLRIHGSCPVCRFLMPGDEAEGKKGVGGGAEGDGREWEMSIRLLVGARNQNNDSGSGLESELASEFESDRSFGSLSALIVPGGGGGGDDDAEVGAVIAAGASGEQDTEVL